MLAFGNKRELSKKRRLPRPHLLALAMIIIETSPGRSAGSATYELWGEWSQADLGEYSYRLMTFEPESRVNFLSGTRDYTIVMSGRELIFGGEGFGASGLYTFDGTILTIDRGADRSDGWVFDDGRIIDGFYQYYDASRVTCTIVITGDQMALSNCEAFHADGHRTHSLTDSVWVRSRTTAP